MPGSGGFGAATRRSILTLDFLRCLVLGAAMLLGVSEPHAAETALSQQVDALFARYDRDATPGVAVGIYKDGRAVYTNGYGYADLEQGTPITPGTVFHVASVSKQFTAFAVALLAQEGKVDLEADVRTYLPFVPDFGETITVEQLIYHTSGLRDQWLLLNMGGHGFKDFLTQEQILKLVARQQELNFSPGSDHAYSNTGYTLLAEIVSAASGHSFREFTSERIFRPLGMADSFFLDDIAEVIPNRAHSYSLRSGLGSAAGAGGDNPGAPGAIPWGREVLSYETVGATSLMTTVDDMLKWMSNLSQPVVGDEALIQQISATGTLNDGTALPYGFGLQRAVVAGHEAMLHTGADAGFRSLFAYFPEEDFGVVILANTPLDRFAPLGAIVDLYLNDGRRVSSLDVPERMVPDPAVVSALEGHYMSANGPMASLHEKDGRLILETSGGQEIPLVFRVDRTFDLGDASRSWSYYLLPETVDTESVSAIVEVQPSSAARVVHRRITPIAPDAVDLGPYVGSYKSSELDTTYTLSIRDGSLVVESLWLPGSTVLVPVMKDRFDTANQMRATLVFERDDSGTISGLRVQRGRVNRIYFKRVEPECMGERPAATAGASQAGQR